jgi:hypothetical protein
MYGQEVIKQTDALLMKDLQIDIIQARLVETRIDRVFGLVITHCSRWHFRGEEDLAAGYANFSYSIGTRLFIAVNPC